VRSEQANLSGFKTLTGFILPFRNLKYFITPHPFLHTKRNIASARKARRSFEN
jgi:hypothetical protein